MLLVKHLHLLLVLRGDFRVQFCVDGVHFFDHFVQFLVACDVIFVLDIFHVGVFAPKLRFGFIKKPFADFREERSEDAPGGELQGKGKGIIERYKEAPRPYTTPLGSNNQRKGVFDPKNGPGPE